MVKAVAAYNDIDKEIDESLLDECTKIVNAFGVQNLSNCGVNCEELTDEQIKIANDRSTHIKRGAEELRRKLEEYKNSNGDDSSL